MRWSEKPHNAHPVHGNRRTKEGFLLFPKRLFNTKTRLYEWRWLERASWTQVYVVAFGEDTTTGFWNSEEWVVPTISSFGSSEEQTS